MNYQVKAAPLAGGPADPDPWQPQGPPGGPWRPEESLATIRVAPLAESPLQRPWEGPADVAGAYVIPAVFMATGLALILRALAGR